jgi:hypothetical protein
VPPNRPICRHFSWPRRVRQAVPRHRGGVLWCFPRQQKSRFTGIFSLLKPSDGLEPSTPSLPWRFRIANDVGRNRSCGAVSPAISVMQALRLTFLGDPSLALRIPAPVPRTYPQRRLGDVAGQWRRGTRDARSLRGQRFQWREAKYREDALQSIIEVSNRLIRANDDRVRLGRRLGLLVARFARHLHQFCRADQIAVGSSPQ